jgi:hypothetical protein
VKTKRTMKWATILAVAAVLLLAALAQPGDAAAPADGYTLSWWTVAGGGDTSVTAGDYTLSSTAGQPGAGELGGGDYTLGGGFWGGGVVIQIGDYYIYLPLVLRSY